MPFIIDSPETKSIEQKYVVGDSLFSVHVSRTLDRVSITQIDMRLPPNDPTGISMTVKWALGYAEGNVFFPVEYGISELAGESLVAAMLQEVTQGLSHYADFKNALYALLASLGQIPAGSVV